MREAIHYASEEGLSLYAKSYGDPGAALTVLCMHGLTRNHKDFEPMIEAIGGPYRFIAVDVRGRGRSQADPNPENYRPDVYARDMQRLLQAAGVAQVALIGTSMGGLMAMLMMQVMPERILGTVLNDVGPVVDAAGLARISAQVATVAPVADWTAASAAVAAAQASVFPEFSEADWMAFAKRTYKELPDGSVMADFDPAISATLSTKTPGLLTRLAMWRLFKQLKPRPLLVVRGERSDILSTKTARRMCARHKSAKLVTVPGVGHAPLLNEPEALAGIDQFLSEIQSAI